MEKLGYELNPTSKKIDGCAWVRSDSFDIFDFESSRSGEGGYNPKKLESENQSFRPAMKGK